LHTIRDVYHQPDNEAISVESPTPSNEVESQPYA